MPHARTATLAPALLVALALGATLGCQGQTDPSPADRAIRRTAADDEVRVLRPEEDARLAPYMDRFGRVEALIQRWDALRADGRLAEADTVAQQIRTDVDAGYGDFERGAGGTLGPHAQYLGVSALGFASTPQATPALVGRLRDRDAELVGNALIALSVRADPDTPPGPVMALIAGAAPLPAKRYAPLVMANLLDARARAGRPPDPAIETRVLGQLGPLAVERDPIVRLHVAKALGALRVSGTYDYLQVLVGDPQMRIRWAAAAALERQGDPRGFPEVVRLLHEVAQESKGVIRDVLVSYAARLQGRPLGAAEIEALGTGARAWSQWFSQLGRARGFPDATSG